ncbi:hypothetical protein OQX63_04010 [Pedobacter sp. PF22-3]|uniref:hypothetical protein n=1 Tax=Pedobacter sp. PF22-3 TaxID=2994467 RepID=UPI0022464AE6|nr:hypothetical protein [Pedobacter sp. PF22-3]MCX2492622.1 hypothetical protein [Pedobacter sp. PF22-3]
MNYLKKHIESLFIECTSLDANLLVLDSFVSSRGQQLQENFSFPNYELIGMITTYRDLSQLEGGDNLYDTKVGYSLTTDNLPTEVTRLLSYIACLTTTQVFEVFESFLKNILSELVTQNPNLSQILKLPNTYNTFQDVRKEISYIQGAGNKGFIKALRKISPFFKQHESKNIWNKNMSHWFDLIAWIRNLVVHSRLVINPQFEEYINEAHRKALFDQHFTISKSDLTKKIELTPYQAHAITQYLFEYAHLIYKSLSTDFGIELDFDFKKVTI